MRSPSGLLSALLAASRAATPAAASASLRAARAVVLAPLLGSAAMGCSLSTAPDAADAEAGTSQAALVTLERSSTDGARVEVVARVVRAHGGPLDEAALRIAGLGDALPVLGTCVPVDGPGLSGTREGGLAGTAASRSLELVELGGVALEVGDTFRAPLVARHVPDPAGVLSGVVYNARLTPEGAGLLAPRATVTVRAQPSPGDVEGAAFTATVGVPRDVADVRLAGQDPRELTSLTSLGAAELTWAADADESSATIGVEVRPSDATRTAYRCAFPDTGRALLPAAALSADEGTLVLRRVQRERFRLEGHAGVRREGEGEIRFDAVRALPYRRARERAL